ncbi:MAG: rplK [Haloplasmataceae bacterium]|jgi:ribosomal protein L11|nr:rplK [Haloplasmataceae bacterium]
MFKNKYLDVIVKLDINSMEASSKEPIGPTLGQYGVPIDKFCEAFNSISSIYLEKTLVRAKVYIYSDKSFEIKVKLPSINLFIKNSLINKSSNDKSIYNSKRKAGYFYELNEFLPVLDKNIIYTIVLYLLSLENYEKIKAFSLFKKIKGTLDSSGILYITC